MMKLPFFRWSGAAAAVVLTGTLCLGVPASAQEQAVTFDPEVTVRANTIIRNIYNRLEEEQSRYRELQDLSAADRSTNKHGVDVLEYFYKDEASRRPSVYAFGVTMVPIDDPLFEDKEGYFTRDYPFLKVKFVGYLQKHPLRRQYDIKPLLEEFDQTLQDYQQAFLPLQLELKTVKDAYQVREDIYFDVELKNVSHSNLSVRGLGEKTLFFLYNNAYWGTRPTEEASGGEPRVLKAGDSLKMRFRGEGFPGAQDVEVSAVYRMSVEGVNPAGVLKIKVVR